MSLKLRSLAWWLFQFPQLPRRWRTSNSLGFCRIIYLYHNTCRSASAAPVPGTVRFLFGADVRPFNCVIFFSFSFLLLRHYLWLCICRCSSQRNSFGSKDIGSSSQRCGRQHQGATGCGGDARLSPVCHGGLSHVDPRSPSGSGSSRRCWESAEIGPGETWCSVWISSNSKSQPLPPQMLLQCYYLFGELCWTILRLLLRKMQFQHWIPAI